MNNKLKRLNNDLVKTLMILFTVIMIIAIADADFKYLNLGSTINYSNNWDKHIDKENNTLILNKDITRDMLGKALVFYTSASFVRAYIGDRQIYDFGKKSEICKSPGSLWQVIEIRNNDRYIGMRLSIHIKTVYNYMFKDDYRIEIGTSGAIMKTKIKSELIELIINVFLLLFGVLMCIIYALEKKNGINIRSNMYLGIASIAAVFWSNCALFTFQLVLPAGVLQYYLYYISFMLMPMALLKYFDNLNPRIDIKVEHFIYIMMCYTLTILQITGLKEFTETLTFYLVITTIILICILIKMFKNPIGNKHKLISIAFSIMLCCIIVNS